MNATWTKVEPDDYVIDYVDTNWPTWQLLTVRGGTSGMILRECEDELFLEFETAATLVVLKLLASIGVPTAAVFCGLILDDPWNLLVALAVFFGGYFMLACWFLVHRWHTQVGPCLIVNTKHRTMVLQWIKQQINFDDVRHFQVVSGRSKGRDDLQHWPSADLNVVVVTADQTVRRYHIVGEAVPHVVRKLMKTCNIPVVEVDFGRRKLRDADVTDLPVNETT